MIREFLQIFLTKKPNNLKTKHPKRPRNSFFFSGQEFWELFAKKKHLLGFIQHFFKVWLRGIFED